MELDLICRLQEAAALAWPATIAESAPGGWRLRATPGLDRARSNNALTPCRRLARTEIADAIGRVTAFAERHDVRPGIQVSPADLHSGLCAELDALGWSAAWPTLVLSRRLEPTGSPSPRTGAGTGLIAEDHASRGWLAAWARCEPGRDVEAHADTVFALLRGRAQFVRAGDGAVAIATERDGLIGLFCMAVDPQRRRLGIGTALVQAVLARSRARLAYLQVEESNLAARVMYERLGFTETYRYVHRVAVA